MRQEILGSDGVMLKIFRFKNSYSYRDWSELNLSAELKRDSFDIDGNPMPKDSELHSTVRNRIKNGRLGILPVAAIYGKNASGKTRLLRTLQDVANDALGNSFADTKAFSNLSPYGQIIKKRRFETLGDELLPLSYFVCVVLKIGEDNLVEFALEYTLESDGVTYEKVKRRSLAANEAETLYERKGSRCVQGSDIIVNHHIELLEAAGVKHLWFPSIAKSHSELEFFFEWFRFVRDGITFNNVSRQSQRFEELAERISQHGENDEVFRKEILQFLQGLDESVTNIEGEKQKNGSYVLWIFHRRKDLEISSLADYIEHESDGTLQLLELFPKIKKVLAEGMPFICDEFDRNLHPVAFRKLVDMFNDPEYNDKNAQLIFTAHDTFVLDSDFLRRDEVHIIDKDSDSVSSIKRLDAKGIRPYPNMEYDFRVGVYGSSPKGILEYGKTEDTSE